MSMACKAFYRVFRGLSYVPMPLDAGDFSLMDRRVVDELLALPETDQFLRGLRAWVGFKQTGVDYVRPERAFGRSTHSRLKNLWWAKKAIFSFSFVPVEILSYAGATMTVLSFFAVVYQVVDSLLHPEIGSRHLHHHRCRSCSLAASIFSRSPWWASTSSGPSKRSNEDPSSSGRRCGSGGTRLSSAAEIESFVGRRRAARRSTEAGAS